MEREEQLRDLRGLVHRYQVCWDSFPEFSRIGHERRQTGTVVELYGTHDRPSTVPTAGCGQCIPVLQALLSIADCLVNGVALASVRAHSGIEYAIERGGRPDIVVSLTFTRAGALAGPELEASIHAVRKRLSTLGASRRMWRQGSTTREHE